MEKNLSLSSHPLLHSITAVISWDDGSIVIGEREHFFWKIVVVSTTAELGGRPPEHASLKNRHQHLSQGQLSLCSQQGTASPSVLSQHLL